MHFCYKKEETSKEEEHNAAFTVGIHCLCMCMYESMFELAKSLANWDDTLKSSNESAVL